MKPSDIPEIMQIENVSFPSPWSSYLFLWELKKENSACFVARYQNRLVGYIVASKVSGEGHITNIAVHPKMRRIGIGKLLLSKCLSTLNARKIFLEVREYNIAAINLYKKFGFKEVGVRRNYYSNGDNAVVMALEH
jgi:ribosomal-protein-alanine N-acetyltransferase